MEPTTDQEIKDLILKLRSLQNNVPKNEELRKELLSSVQNLSYSLESPIETVKRISYLPIQLALSKVAIDLKLFDILSSRNSPISTSELAVETKANPILLKRILQYLASVGIVQRDGPDIFSASKITLTLAQTGFQAGVKHHYEVHLPAWTALAQFLKSTAYDNPSDDLNTPFQIAHQTHLPAYRWALSHPILFQDFNQWMVAQRAGEKTWLDVIPESLISRDADSTSPLFVDIGGGVGHQCAALLARYPSISRGILLQDLAPVIAHALPTPGVSALPHDFWAEQPVKNASIYYLRNVLHNYPDAKCVELLQRTLEAMGPSSVILIDEIVLADDATHWQAAQLDITMMASVAAMERSHGQWLSLLHGAGLKLESVWKYTEETAESLMVVKIN